MHVIAEHRGADIEKATLLQRLLVCVARDLVNEHVGALRIERRGDDLYDGHRKLSISVATTSARCGLIHFAVNVRASENPLPVQGIANCGLEPRAFAETLLEAYATELAGIAHATGKVRPVGVWKETNKQ